jgi:hypothetical protein
MNIKFLSGMFCGVAFMTSIVAVSAQQAAPPADTQELQLQLNLTDQALSNANHQFIAERTQTLILRNSLAQAQADTAKMKAESDKKDKQIADQAAKLDALVKEEAERDSKKDKEIADLRGQLASSAKSEAATHPMVNATPVPKTPISESPASSVPAVDQPK